MKWLELCINVPEEFVEPVAYVFTRYGRALSLEKADQGQVIMRTYLPSTSRQRLARIEVGVRLLAHILPTGVLQVRPLEAVQWREEWKRHFHLLRIGSKLVIKPSWIEYDAKGTELVIELDPGMAFGTGHHPTTHTCLEALEENVRPGMKVLDLGTGSGILSLAAVKLGAKDVVALDIDPLAVRACRENLTQNGVDSGVHVARGTIPHRLTQDKNFDLVTANISSRVIKEYAHDLLGVLAPGGILITSGIIQEHRQDVETELIKTGLIHVKNHIMEDWCTLIFARNG